jgi:cytidyltransferase-like protein
MRRVYVAGAFDNPGPEHLRFLQEAARLGPVTLVLSSDEDIARVQGTPKTGLAERRYFFEALRYVDKVEAAPPGHSPDSLDPWLGEGDEGPLWVVGTRPGFAAGESNAARRSWSDSRGVELRVLPDSLLEGFPYEAPPLAPPLAAPNDGPALAARPRVVVTGCYDWLHTGHLRFFEEASAFGELNVVIGSDKNVRLLKGEGHPLFPETQRRYMVGSFRSVARCLVSTGEGWLDAEPEIRALGARRYVVNEDGDKDEKRRYCEELGIEYIVLKRAPKEGLPRRSSTDLRGY